MNVLFGISAQYPGRKHLVSSDPIVRKLWNSFADLELGPEEEASHISDNHLYFAARFPNDAVPVELGAFIRHLISSACNVCVVATYGFNFASRAVIDLSRNEVVYTTRRMFDTWTAASHPSKTPLELWSSELERTTNIQLGDIALPTPETPPAAEEESSEDYHMESAFRHRLLLEFAETPEIGCLPLSDVIRAFDTLGWNRATIKQVLIEGSDT